MREVADQRPRETCVGSRGPLVQRPYILSKPETCPNNGVHLIAPCITQELNELCDKAFRLAEQAMRTLSDVDAVEARGAVLQARTSKAIGDWFTRFRVANLSVADVGRF